MISLQEADALMSPDRRKAIMMSSACGSQRWLSGGGSVRGRTRRRRQGGLRPNWNIARLPRAVGQGYLDIFRCRDWPDSTRIHGSSVAGLHERRRTNPIMFNVAHVLSPSMLTALATHFRGLNPKPFGGAPRGSISTGKKIYDEGLPEANVPACSACHGMDGKGQNEIPRLAGQLYPYTVGQLTSWKTVRGQGSTVDTSAIMAPTAHNLTRSQVEAVAAYVSYLQ